MNGWLGQNHLTDEEVIVGPLTVFTQGMTKTHYNIYLTSKRFVAIHTVRGQNPYGAYGAGVAAVAGAVLNKRGKDKEAAMAGLTLDQMIVSDGKSFAWPYDQLKKVKLHTNIWKRVLEVKGSGHKLELYLDGRQLDNLKEALPTISALSGILEVS